MPAGESCPLNFKKSLLGVPLMVAFVFVCFTLFLLVLSSGFTLSAGNKSSFCVRCHVMEPFVRSWADSSHGGNNRWGIVVECMDCHLPHDSLARFLLAKIKGGFSLLISNLSIDGTTFDWYSNAKRHRQHFTHDASCSNCHQRLQQFCSQEHEGVRLGQRAEGSTCLGCHPNVGHRNVMSVAEKFFQQQAAVSPGNGKGCLVIDAER